MERQIIITEDGSHTVSIPEWGVTYHSVYGAVRESQHVFIEAGLRQFRSPGYSTLKVFEMGLGTGLNALLALAEAEKTKQSIYYEAVELFPLSVEEINSLNYCRILHRVDLQKTFELLHSCDWQKEIAIHPNFIFKKLKSDLLHLPPTEFPKSETFEIIFFDAFDPNIQPELWTKEIFDKMFSVLRPGGILVTYSSRAQVRRAMQAAGFRVEKIPGPPRKREIVRAEKLKQRADQADQ